MIKAHLRCHGCVCLLAYNCTRRGASLTVPSIWTFLTSLGEIDEKCEVWVDESIDFAASEQREELGGILAGHDLAMAGETEDHVVLLDDGKILAGALLWQMDEGLFHLLVFGVRHEERNTGVGRRLLQEISRQPWKYCRDASEPGVGAYRITTVARGKSASFYQKCGFRACDFSLLPIPFDGQCDSCPDREECKPVAMDYQGAKSNGAKF